MPFLMKIKKKYVFERLEVLKNASGTQKERRKDIINQKFVSNARELSLTFK